MDQQPNKNTCAPLIYIGIMFFTLGFALGINSFVIPALRKILNISSGLSYLVLAATFSTFIIFSYPSSLLIKKIGYKYTMTISFTFFSLAFITYIISSKYTFFFIFLIASFVSGIGNTILQADVNPYTTILGPSESAAKRPSAMSICNKIVWSIAHLLISLIIKKDINILESSDLLTPFLIILIIFVLLGVSTLIVKLPEVSAIGENSVEIYKPPIGKTSIWQFPHLWLGMIAMFFYVGVETIALSTLIDYAESINLSHADYYSWLSTAGMVIGCLFGLIVIPKLLSQIFCIKLLSWHGMSSVFLVCLTPEKISIFFMSFSFISVESTTIFFEEPSNLQIIRSHCFQSSTIISIQLPNSLLSIEKFAFSFSFSLLKSIQILSPIKQINESLFSYSSQIENISINNSYILYNQVLNFTKSSVQVLEDSCFKGITIKTLILSSNISPPNFSLFSQVEDIEIYCELKHIPNMFFYQCSTLKSIKILNQTILYNGTLDFSNSIVESIGIDSFSLTSINHIKVPSSVSLDFQSFSRISSLVSLNIDQPFETYINFP
jgi:fucose permease